ncbi:MAG: hypothetical protein ABIY50_06090 [Ignavibacteria bacterium]
MKKYYLFLFSITFLMVINCPVFSQANSIELQDGGGTFISSHSSIEEAYNAIPSTITQAYIIEILAAYTGASELFPIDLGLKTGHSTTNTITIRPDAGNTGEIISSGNTAGIININDADFVTIDGRPGGTGTTPDLEIRNTATTGTNSNTVSLLGGSTNCAVRYCKLFNATQGSAGPRTFEFGASASNVSGNSDNVLENCLISGGRSGIGCDGTTANPNRNNKIINNTVTDFAFTGIWLLTAVASDWLIEGNLIDQVTGYNITNPTAINIGSTLSANVIIRKNKILDVRSTSTSLTGLTIRGIASSALSAGATLTIENNFISQTANNNNVISTYGILMTGTVNAYTANIYYNSILIGGTQTTGAVNRIVSAGIINNTTVAAAVFNIKNNIVINTRSGGVTGVKHAAVAYNDLNPQLNIDYNCYFATAGADGYHALVDSTGYNNIDNYRAAISPNEQNSRFKNVSFVSTTDLHLTGASIGDPDLSARPISGITTDIDGQIRSTSFPYKGADESTPFTLKTLNLTVNLEACSPMQDTISVSLRNTTAPYGLIEMTKVYLSSTGTATVNFVKAVDGVSYYIVVNHRNSIETWSKLGGEVFTGGVLNYNFTTAASQAFGNNMVNVGGKWSNYTGDVTQDGIVDGADGALIDNDASNFVTGYVPTDLNCDSIVDGSDAAFADNNASNFVAVARP